MTWLQSLEFILGILMVNVIVQTVLVFKLRHWPLLTNKKKSTPLPSVSVIICSHNDLTELKKNLPRLLSQQFSKMEVIVVDDHSDDDTSRWLYNILSDTLRIITLRDQKKPGKRAALIAGIKAAKHEWVVLIDADCQVPGLQWLQTLASNFTEEYIGFIGYGPHSKKPGILNKLIRFDTAQIASLYLSSAAGNFPYMGVGRNMGWNRRVFPELIEALEQLPTMSGDDDLVLQKLRDQGKIQAIAEPCTFVYSDPKKTILNWLKQKSRHHTTGWKYQWKDMLWLGTWQISCWIFYLTWITCYLIGLEPIVCLGIFILRSSVVWGWMAIRFNNLLEKDLILFIPLLEIIHTFVQPVFSIYSLVKTSKSWK